MEASASTEDRLSPLEQASEECLRRVQKKLDEFRENRQVPGVTLGFVLHTGGSGALASGVSDKTTGRAMTPGDRMLLGSIGKTYVAAVVLELVEEGRLDLDSKISHWFGVDEWFSRLPNAHDITLRALMNHTSGIPRYIYTPEFQAAVKAEPHKTWRPEELVSFILDTEPLFPAGQGWSYADTNYILVGIIVERVTGRTYYEELGDRVLKPLRLSDTSPSDQAELRGLVSGYTSEGNVLGLPVEVARGGRCAINPQFEWTGGGLVTTSAALARWAKLLYGGAVLEPESLRQMLDGVETAPGSDRKYGLAAMMRPSAHGPVVGHAGYMPGYVSMMAYYLKHDTTVA
jgi:D-alanyl-D-alanine carboxypeptidase